jgi:hypothetical protein
MPLAYNPSNRTLSKVQYMVNTTGDQWFIPTTGYGDNPNSGTTAQRLAACKVMSGKKSDGTTDIAEQVVV